MNQMMGRICWLVSCLFIGSVFAASPVLTFTPLSNTTMVVRGNDTATIQYLVQNQSNRHHSLVMKPITGITQITSAGNCPSPFALNAGASCRLSLQINGSQLIGNVVGGPVVCQQKPNGQPNPLLCYQPSPPSILRITKAQALFFYAGTQNGNIYYSSNNGSTWQTIANNPFGGSAINSIFATTQSLYAGAANGFIYYSTNGGNSWNNTTPPDGSAVNSVFLIPTALYAGTANGYVYYSTNNGRTWQSTTQPDGSAVNSVFVTTRSLYAGTANGFVYYSTNNGMTWTAINGKPDDTSIRNIFIALNTLYVNTTKEYAYSSAALTGGGHWTRLAQTVYSLFVSANNATLYAGTQSGHVFSLTTGDDLGFVTYSPINTLYVVG